MTLEERVEQLEKTNKFLQKRVRLLEHYVGRSENIEPMRDNTKDYLLLLDTVYVKDDYCL